jgi:hypothetical protein
MKRQFFTLLAFVLSFAAFAPIYYPPVTTLTVTPDAPAVSGGIGRQDAIAVMSVDHGNLDADEDFSATIGYHSATLTQACTFTLSDFAVGPYISTIVVDLNQDTTGGWTVTWPAAVVSAPSVNSIPSTVTRIWLETRDGGTTITARSDFATEFTVTDKSAAYTFAASDSLIRHPSTDNNARTFTINSNANLAIPIGKSITIVNEINVITLAITTDTLTLQGANNTGSVDIAAGNVATIVKVASTKWICTGTNGVTHH